jgi:serine/threonine protein kinase
MDSSQDSTQPSSYENEVLPTSPKRTPSLSGSLHSENSTRRFSFLKASTDEKNPHSLPKVTTAYKRQISVINTTMKPKIQPSHKVPVETIEPVIQIDTDCVFDEFDKIKHLCNGSNSSIFKSTMNNNRKVILKVLLEEKSNDPVAVHEFKMEGQVLQRLKHANIVIIEGIGNYEESSVSGKGLSVPRPYIVLERLMGGVCTDFLRLKFLDQSPFSPLRAMRILIDFISALQYIHEEFHETFKIIHRDLKPDNLGFTANGTLKVMDFGLAAVVPKLEDADHVYNLTGLDN